MRCDLADYLVNELGRRPDAIANQPYDNRGITYGRIALARGLITAQQFVDLNSGIGGYDVAWQPRAQRSTADYQALYNAYRSGLVDQAKLTASVPIIDLRTRDQDELHQDIHSFVMRARLIAANGTAGNQVIWRDEGEDTNSADPAAEAAQLVQMDAWLTAIHADHRSGSLAAKVLRNRPTTTYDGCWLAGHEIANSSTCALAFPTFTNPRMAAGGP